MGKSYVHQSQEDDCWEVKIDTIEKCSKAPEEIKVYMAPLVKAKINALMKKFPNMEWFSYLIGKKIENTEDFLVENLLIPQQKVTSSSVTDVVCPEFNKFPIIGAIHSHHHMGTGFSHTDDKWVNQNHDVSLVVATNGIAGQVRWQTPCGGMLILDAKVLPYINVEFDKDEFYKLELDKIQEETYIPVRNQYAVQTHVFGMEDNSDETDDSLLLALQEAYPDDLK